MVVTKLVVEYNHLKLKLGLFLTGYVVSMVTCQVRKMTMTCWPMFGHLLDTTDFCGINSGINNP